MMKLHDRLSVTEACRWKGCRRPILRLKIYAFIKTNHGNSKIMMLCCGDLNSILVLFIVKLVDLARHKRKFFYWQHRSFNKDRKRGFSLSCESICFTGAILHENTSTQNWWSFGVSYRLRIRILMKQLSIDRCRYSVCFLLTSLISDKSLYNFHQLWLKKIKEWNLSAEQCQNI